MIGDSFVSNVQWGWNWPGWATALASATAALWIIVLYAREQPFVSGIVRAALAVLRIAALAIIVALLVRPMVARQRVVRPRLKLLADRSASMATRDVPASTGAPISRLEAWKGLLAGGSKSFLGRLSEQYDIEVFTFDAETQPIAATAIAATGPAQATAENSTRLGDAIDFVLRQLAGPRPTAVVVLSDGVVTQGLPLADAAARARIVGTAIFAVGIGSDRPRPDVSLDDLLVEEVAFPGDRLEVEAAVRAVGLDGKTVRVTLFDVGPSEKLAETDVVLPADGAAGRVHLALRAAEPGSLRLRLEAAELPGEEDIDNNRREAVVDVRAQPIRVLLAASTPSFEYRALKSMLERDPAIELHALLQEADADYASVDAAAVAEFPVSEAEQLEYDVIILDDVDPNSVPRDAWPKLLEFVSVHGGGLALVSGPRFLPQAYRDLRPMETLLPIELSSDPAWRSPREGPAEGFSLSPTSLGRSDVSLQLGESADQSDAVWKALPPVWRLFESFSPKPGAEVLAENPLRSNSAGGPLPVILRHYVGAGEVLMHTTDETWRWRWRSDDRYFARYWGQSVRRLARGRALRGGPSLSTNGSDYKVGEPVTLRARLRSAARGADDRATVRLETAGQPTREIELSRNWRQSDAFETTLRDLPAGEYAAQLMIDQAGRPPARARFSVSAPPDEMARLVVNSAGLAEAARTTGGKYYDMTNWEQMLDELPPPRPVAVEQLPDRPLWNANWLLAMLCAALGAEWLLRRRSGML